jgi:Kef-type K+ transport system membrane component KefB/voltage-gated potassium channel Kch
MQSIFLEIGLIVTLASVLGYVMKLLKQPLIPAYVMAGLIVGPIFGLVSSNEVVGAMSDIGIAMLLFIVGLEIDFKKLRDVGKVAIFGGLINSSFLFALGFILATLLAFSAADSLYLGLIIAFGSTMVVVKLLSDKRELDTLHGRILVGILLMEDLISVIVLSAISRGSIALSLLKFGALVVVAFISGRFVLPTILKNGAKHPELLFLLSLSTCFSFAALALALGISMAIGAFMAGLTIANLPYRVEIISRVRSLRDFFATIFFVSLGMQVGLPSLGRLILPFLVFFIAVTLAKPFMLMNIVSLFGYNKKVSFLSAVSMAQISEFALIITALGRSLGQVSDSVFTLAILLAISTITLSSYAFKYDNQLFQLLNSRLHFLNRWDNGRNEAIDGKKRDIVVCGYNRIGFNIVDSLQRLNKNFVVVDYNPEIIKQLTARNIPCIYGDVGDVDVLERLELGNVRMVVSTVPDAADTSLLIKKTREQNQEAAVIVTASQLNEALQLYTEGADYVVLPHFLGGVHASKLIESFNEDPINIINERLKHIEELQIREEMGHEHPTHQ